MTQEAWFKGEWLEASALAKVLDFAYLPRLAFQSIEDEQIVRGEGVAKREEEERGNQFSELIQSSYLAPAEVKWVCNQVEYGLFASEEISKGDYVGEYVGVVRKNEREYFQPMNDYLYAYPVADELERPYVIDATSGSLCRFINHSFSPNLDQHFAFIEGAFHLIFIANREIRAGEQLKYNYGKEYWYLRGQPDEL